MRALEASPLLDELDMRLRPSVFGSCVILCTTLACARDARAEEQPTSTRSTSTTTVVGASALGVGYVPMFVMATGSLGHAMGNIKLFCGGGSFFSSGRCPEHDAIALYVPVIGPLLYAQPNTGDDLYRRDRGPSSTEQALLYSSAALQFGGLVTLLVGVASDNHRKQHPSTSPTVAGPMTTNGANGVMVASTF